MFNKNLRVINLQELAGLLNKYVEKTIFNTFKNTVENTFSNIFSSISKMKKTFSNASVVDFIELTGSGASYTISPGTVLSDKDGILWIFVGLNNLNFVDNLSGYPNSNRTDDLTFKKIALNKLLLTSGIIKMNYQKNGYEFNGNLYAISKTENGNGANIFASISDKPQFGTLYAYSVLDPTKFAKYSLYKANASIAPVHSLIQNTGLTITSTNALGTVALSDSSENIKMVVEIVIPNFA